MGARVEELVWVVAQLRRHCPWTRALTHDRLTEYLVEEAYEAVEAIEVDAGDEALRAELGDVLFQVVLHAALAQDRHAFDLEDVAAGITAKMLRRNPHVFTPEGALRPPEELTGLSVAELERQWEAVKAQERAAQADGAAAAGEPDGAETPSVPPTTDRALAELVSSLPTHLPALAAAAKAVDRAARREPNPLPAPAAPLEVSAAALTDEQALGEALFTLVRHARAAGLDPERALRRRLRGAAEEAGR